MPNDLMKVSYSVDNIPIELSRDIITRFISGGRTDIPDSELLKFIQLCAARKLNPFVGDAYLLPYKNQKTNKVTASVVVSRDYYQRVAESHTQYDGMESGILVASVQDGKTVIEQRSGTLCGETNEKLVGGWATVYRKDKGHPTYISVSLKEYNKGQGLWTTMPATMIRKVAVVQALREAFPSNFSGLYDTSELPSDDNAPTFDTYEYEAPVEIVAVVPESNDPVEISHEYELVLDQREDFYNGGES